jgi:4-amino-4-deoxy-L-arabinose transferase-like glycosyltransferase
MPAARLGWARLGAVLGLSALTLGVGLGSSGRLTYHEAFVAQAAREMLARGAVVTPTVGGHPWLEKPPLAIWLAALAGRAGGGVSETAARAPSAAAAALLAAGVALLAARRFGPAIGVLAGLVQATTAWTVMRGRLAEADILLACLVTWTLLAFDRLRSETSARSVARAETTGGTPGGTGGLSTSAPAASSEDTGGHATSATRRDIIAAFRGLFDPPGLWRWGFFLALGLTALAKGVGFGAVLVLAAVIVVLGWDGDRAALRRLWFAPGWGLAALLALAWPLLVLARHPSALRLWAVHVTDRLATHPEHFAGQTGWQYGLGLLVALLPWVPLGVVGAGRSLPQALSRRGRGGGERLLFAWALAPLALLLMASVRNAHYAIHALPPWSIWAGLGLTRLAQRWRARGWPATRVRVAAWGTFAGLGLAYAVGFAGLGPRLDRRGVEWAFYESAARRLEPGEPVALLYHVPQWDREPYETPFGSFPHDYAVRLFYLNHPAQCRFGIDQLTREPLAPEGTGFAVIGREGDVPALERLGQVETLARGPGDRSDRTYRLFRVTPSPVAARAGDGLRR